MLFFLWRAQNAFSGSRFRSRPTRRELIGERRWFATLRPQIDDAAEVVAEPVPNRGAIRAPWVSALAFTRRSSQRTPDGDETCPLAKSGRARDAGRGGFGGGLRKWRAGGCRRPAS